MKFLLLLSLIFISSSARSQNFIGLPKQDCHNKMDQFNKANGWKSIYEESQSTLIFNITRASIPYTTISLLFDKEGKCITQTHSFFCDSCFYYGYQKIFKDRSFLWKKGKHDIYKSQTSGGILLEIPKDTFLMFRIRKV